VTDVWTTVALLAVGTVLIKSAGPLTVGGRDLPPRVRDVLALLAPALLAALVVQETIGAEEAGVSVDARLVGVGAAALGLLLRLPLLVVVVLAAGAAALARAVA
jgi:branched-subunit amino acid transport protein